MLHLLDQRLLPSKVLYRACRDYRAVAAAIRSMVVRGAPAIGVAAAYGVALAALRSSPRHSAARAHAAIRHLRAARPTAVNLFWALTRMDQAVMRCGGGDHLGNVLLAEARNMHDEDVNTNRRIGAYGADLLPRKAVVLTHCNAGALATAGYGTALGVIRSAYRRGRIGLVYVDETRPYLQGARLTAFELAHERIPHILITDNMAGYFMKKGDIQAVLVGADRIAANGDTANKIGTYPLAVLARYHRIPFYVAAPASTYDRGTPDGSSIVIEERSSDEVTIINGKRIAPAATRARHPGFDVTPAGLITGVITEFGVFAPRSLKTAISRVSRQVKAPT